MAPAKAESFFFSYISPPSENESHSVVFNSLRPHGLHSPWNSPGQNTGVGRLSFLQGIFPTQGLNPGLLHCRQILYQLSHKGNPRILEWVAYTFSSGSSWPRNWTRVSSIADRFFTNWAIREAPGGDCRTSIIFWGMIRMMWLSTFILTPSFFPGTQMQAAILSQ